MLGENSGRILRISPRAFIAETLTVRNINHNDVNVFKILFLIFYRSISYFFNKINQYFFIQRDFRAEILHRHITFIKISELIKIYK